MSLIFFERHTMLAQEKRVLAQEMVTGALHIREKELHLFHDSLSAVGMQSALFAGFAFSALVEFEIPDDAGAGMSDRGKGGRTRRA